MWLARVHFLANGCLIGGGNRASRASAAGAVFIAFHDGPERRELTELDAAGVVSVSLLKKVEQLAGVLVIWLLIPARKR